MGYVTFVDLQGRWRLYRGVGDAGEILCDLNDATPLHDLSAAREPILWVCSQSSSSNQETSVQRVTLPALSSEPVAWNRGRVGALAAAPDGRQVVALELPSETSQQPALWLWDGNYWKGIKQQVISDISSKLAWLDDARIVYESTDRRLTILDLVSGETEIGPSGCCPAAAADIREWYALSSGRVVTFPFEQSFSNPPTALAGFDFGNVTTLRVTRDGNVFTWTEPRWGYRSKGYLQERGQARKRFPPLDEGIGAVLGQFESV
jgi:hypothetical protein